MSQRVLLQVNEVRIKKRELVGMEDIEKEAQLCLILHWELMRTFEKEI